jgi:NAD-dependent SIR2 family protein deacetylase
MVELGFNTAYECMGLMAARNVPATVKWGFWCRHYSNLRYLWEPNAGYSELLKMAANKDHFVLTSNVDGCFERAGFAPDKIYTPQGDCAYYQCLGPCRPDAAWRSEEVLKRLRDKWAERGCLEEEDVPVCKHCGGDVFVNLRAGRQFIHKPYVRARQRTISRGGCRGETPRTPNRGLRGMQHCPLLSPLH